jgi:hypothetical protein
MGSGLISREVLLCVCAHSVYTTLKARTDEVIE